MDQATLIEALGKYMDVLEKVSYSTLFLTLGIGWAGLQGKDINALGMSFNRRQAFVAATVVYIFVDFLILVLFLRLGDLLTQVDAGQFNLAAAELATHTWCMNPFAFFGDDAWSALFNVAGFGLLIFLWWLCNASLMTLAGDRYTAARIGLWVLFFALGLSTVRAIIRVVQILLARSVGEVSAGYEALRALNYWASGIS